MCCRLSGFAADRWNGDSYSQNSTSQKDAAHYLLSQLQFEGNEEVLDLGCGDGKISYDIAKDLTVGHVVGLDISPSMISYAQAHFSAPNLDFILGDFHDFRFPERFDMVVSFAALMWSNDHEMVISRSYQALKSGGTFVVSMPMGLPESMQEIVSEMIASDEWAPYYSEDFHTGWNFITPEAYAPILQKNGFRIDSLQKVLQQDRFPSPTAFKGFISQWFPYLRPLPAELKGQFMQQVIDRYLQAGALMADGQVEFNVWRLEGIATKA
ncbi:MAG: putative trans-aconitate 2-methyltransferase [Chlamydiia bacterium]|nr:putative trans-aconitate 2-methyltransferase [Chlamydiia bacterium]